MPSPTVRRGRPCRPHRLPARSPGDAAAAAAAVFARILFLVAAIYVLFQTIPPYALASGGEGSSSSAPSKSGTTETVGGVSVQLGDKVGQQGTVSTVYKAKHGPNEVIYKEALPTTKIGQVEVDATRAAGQLISAEGNKMVQKKVGTTGLKDWLYTQKESTEAKSKFLLSSEKPESHPNKVKLSDAIYSQVAQKQKDTGYVHYDPLPANIRVHASPSDKPVEFG
ncbi:hypothetical protein DFJ73DRAFT_784756 [Zopfochytrium polystomum]|nr:hypothetical protein DFJ73DRAFT_784756 [Zopfochytrium polystomum]